jgi:hypothetical protein
MRLPPHANAEVHARIMADLRRMTPAEFLVSLVHAGICTPDGKLTEHYAQPDEAPDAEE